MSDLVMPDSVAAMDDVMCGCLTPSLAWGFVHRELKRNKDWHDYHKDDTWPPTKPYTNEFAPPEDKIGAYLFGVYVLSHMEYTEHGGSLSYPWLTDKGEELLAFLEQYGDDWGDKYSFIDNNEVSRGVIL